MDLKATEPKQISPDRIWTGLPKLCLPSRIVDKKTGTLALDDIALNILTALLALQRNETIRRLKRYRDTEQTFVDVKADRETLIRMTGIPKNRIAAGIRSLQQSGWIEKLQERAQQRDRLQQFAATEYRLFNPKTGEPLETVEDERLLHANGLHYFTVPSCIFATQPKTKPASYSFATMSFPEKRLYITLAWLATQRRSNEFDTTSEELRRITGLSHKVLKASLNGLETRGLVWNSGIGTLRNLHIHLRHPFTRELLATPNWDRNPRKNFENYYEEYAEGRSKRANFRLSPEEAEKLFLQALDEKGESATAYGDEWKFCCPFHADSNPSCSFNPIKGCFLCFAGSCGETGTTRKLLVQLLGDREAAVMRIAAEKGKTLEYVDPDRNAIAIYDYLDKWGNSKKQVVRYPNDADGNKVFRQRRLGKGGWVYTTKGLSPMLFNLPALDYSDTIIICEGEKDATTVTELRLRGRYGEAVGTTSGHASSWRPELAKNLVDRRVIILPDDDEAGRGYADSIEESLKAENIEYRRISFEGTGSNDVSEFMAKHTTEDLVRLIGVDWVAMPDGTWLTDPLAPSVGLSDGMSEDETVEL